MITLALTTSTNQGGIALFKDGAKKPFARKIWTGSAGKGDACVLYIENALKKSKCKTKDISKILLDIGPGSFTGIRVSVSFAKTLCGSLNIPLYCISSLEIIEIQNKIKKGTLWVIMDAQRDLFYVWNPKTRTISLEKRYELLNKIGKSEAPKVIGGISKKMTKNFPLPETMVQIYLKNPALYALTDWNKVEPLYIRSPDIVEKRFEN